MGRLTLHVREDHAACASLAADVVIRTVASGVSRIGVATGATFDPVYREIVRRQPQWPLVELFLLDEYLGLPDGDPRSFRATIDRLLRKPLNIAADRLHGPLDHPRTPYDQVLEASGGIQLQLLGIGTNGHVGFNEPGASFACTTRKVALSERTREDNRRHFPNPRQVPTHAVTQGIVTILRARRLVLVACGVDKSDALAGALEGPVCTDLPASAIRWHPNVDVIADRDATAGLVGGVGTVGGVSIVVNDHRQCDEGTC